MNVESPETRTYSRRLPPCSQTRELLGVSAKNDASRSARGGAARAVRRAAVLRALPGRRARRPSDSSEPHGQRLAAFAGARLLASFLSAKLF